MRVLALDLGDAWTGTAMSDPLKIIATPYKSVRTEAIISFLHELFEKEKIYTVIVGYLRTMRETENEQSKKVLAQKK